MMIIIIVRKRMGLVRILKMLKLLKMKVVEEDGIGEEDDDGVNGSVDDKEGEDEGSEDGGGEVDEDVEDDDGVE